MSLTRTDARTDAQSQLQTSTAASTAVLDAPARQRRGVRRSTTGIGSSSKSTSTQLTDTIEAREQLAAQIERDRSENKTGLIYMVLLGGAACLALAGVVSTAQAEASTGVDAPPPAVFEQPATGN